MKSFSPFYSVLCAIVMSSASAAETPIPAAQLKNYVSAVFLALPNSPRLNCIDQRGEFSTEFADSYENLIREYLPKASNGSLNQDGSQPLLTFNLVSTQTRKLNVYLTTAPDYRVITSMRFEELERKTTNAGDLLNPVIQSSFYVKGECTCRSSASPK